MYELETNLNLKWRSTVLTMKETYSNRHYSSVALPHKELNFRDLHKIWGWMDEAWCWIIFSHWLFKKNSRLKQSPRLYIMTWIYLFLALWLWRWSAVARPPFCMHIRVCDRVQPPLIVNIWVYVQNWDYHNYTHGHEHVFNKHVQMCQTELQWSLAVGKELY